MSVALSCPGWIEQIAVMNRVLSGSAAFHFGSSISFSKGMLRINSGYFINSPIASGNSIKASYRVFRITLTFGLCDSEVRQPVNPSQMLVHSEYVMAAPR